MSRPSITSPTKFSAKTSFGGAMLAELVEQGLGLVIERFPLFQNK